MFGIRILIYLLGIALVIWILLRLARGQRQRVEKKPTRQVNDMVRCEHCGTFVPRHEAISEDEHYYCCNQHRDEDR